MPSKSDRAFLTKLLFRSGIAHRQVDDPFNEAQDRCNESPTDNK